MEGKRGMEEREMNVEMKPVWWGEGHQGRGQDAWLLVAAATSAKPLLPQASVSSVWTRGDQGPFQVHYGGGELAPRRGHRRTHLSRLKKSGGVHDMGLHSLYPGWPKQRGPGRHPEVEFEGVPRKKGELTEGWGPWENASLSPPVDSSPHL